MGVRLPAEYQEVEYLESTETQYLIAPWDGTPNIVHVKGRFMYVKLTTVEDDWDSIFGVPYLALGYNRSDKLRLLNRSYRYGYVGFTNISALTIYDFEASQSGSKLSVTLNGIQKTGTTTQKTFVESNLYIFAMRAGYGYGNMRIYNLKAYSTIDDSNLIRDFIPCYRKADDKPGMYDLVSKTFFTNAGTGEFLVGPDVIDSISPLMVAWRRGLMRKEPELYPIGTDVVSMYAANWVDNSSWSNTGGTSGISGASRCTNFIPINPKYTYRKNGYRLYNYCCWYDKDKHFIRSFYYNNTTAQDIANIPENARYMRISTYTANKEDLKVIRIA